MSNAAALCKKPKAYLVWGVQDDTHEIVGTKFAYRKEKKGNEELVAWLVRMINPKINFQFYEIVMDENIKVILLEIPCAETEPTKYGATAYIRIGSNLKPLVGYKEKEAELWRLFDTVSYELRIAAHGTTKEDRIRTCYMQACFAYVNFQAINNGDMRKVFGLLEKDKVKVSRVIKDTIDAGLIKPLDNTAPRHMKYIPYWA